MRYFQLKDVVTIASRWHLGDIKAADVAPELRAGIAFQGELTAEISRMGIPLDFSLTSFAVPVATRSVGSAIESIAAADLQQLPVEIPGHSNFVVLNALRIVACLDEEHSMYTKWTSMDHRSDLAGKYRMVTRLRLDPQRIPDDAHFFRVEDWKIALIVSEPVRLAMERVRCHGAKFVEVT